MHRFCAFISYSHRDAEPATWLHRALERFPVPARIVGRETPIGPVPAKLAPIFLDRDEMSASADLGANIRAALSESAALIVICSPAAVASRWVNEEVSSYIALGRADRIVCLVVGGDPAAGVGEPGQCFPAPLLEGGRIPLAADIRPGQDPRRDARTKLAAALLGVGYDELRQREQMRRRRVLAIAGSAAAAGVATLAVLVTITVQERREADRQRLHAQSESRSAQATAELAKSLFRSATPEAGTDIDQSRRQMLDASRDQVLESLRTQPKVGAALTSTLGEAYGSLGYYSEGSQWLDRGRSVSETLDARLWFESTVAAAEVKYLHGDYDESEKLYRSALARRDAAGGLLLSRAEAGLAEVLTYRDQLDEAKTLLDSAQRRDLLLPPGVERDTALARDLAGLGTLAFYANDTKRAIEIFESALELHRRVFGDGDVKVGQDLNAIGAAYYMAGDTLNARERFLEALPIYERRFGPTHPETATLLNNLARIALERGDYRDAVRRLQRTLEIDLAMKGPTHDDLAFTYGNLGLAYVGVGDVPHAEESYRHGLEIADRYRHRMRGAIRADLADLLCRTRRYDEAATLVATARVQLKQDYPGDPWRAAVADNVEGGCALARGERVRAKQLLTRSTPAIVDHWGNDRLYGRDARARMLRLAEGPR